MIRSISRDIKDSWGSSDGFYDLLDQLLHGRFRVLSNSIGCIQLAFVLQY